MLRLQSSTTNRPSMIEMTPTFLFHPLDISQPALRQSGLCPSGHTAARVLVFAKNAKADEAQAAGADYVGAEELIPKIQNEGWFVSMFHIK